VSDLVKELRANRVMGLAHQAADEIERLEALTDRQVKRTGELTGQVDKLLQEIESLTRAVLQATGYEND